MRFLIRTLFVGIAIFLIANYTDLVWVEDFVTSFLAAFSLGIINATIRPLILILTLPINILTLGCFTLIINGLMLYLVAFFLSGFRIEGFLTAVIASIIISFISTVASFLSGK